MFVRVKDISNTKLLGFILSYGIAKRIREIVSKKGEVQCAII